MPGRGTPEFLTEYACLSLSISAGNSSLIRTKTSSSGIVQNLPSETHLPRPDSTIDARSESAPIDCALILEPGSVVSALDRSSSPSRWFDDESMTNRGIASGCDMFDVEAFGLRTKDKQLENCRAKAFVGPLPFVPVDMSCLAIPSTAPVFIDKGLTTTSDSPTTSTRIAMSIPGIPMVRFEHCVLSEVIYRGVSWS